MPEVSYCLEHDARQTFELDLVNTIHFIDQFRTVH